MSHQEGGQGVVSDYHKKGVEGVGEAVVQPDPASHRIGQKKGEPGLCSSSMIDFCQGGKSCTCS